MCRDMEEIYSEGMESGRLLGLEEGEYIGAEKKAKEMAQSLAKMGFPVQQIAEAAQVTVEVVQSWIGEGMMSTK